MSGHKEGWEDWHCPSEGSLLGRLHLHYGVESKGVVLCYSERGLSGTIGSREQSCSPFFTLSDLTAVSPQDDLVQLADLEACFILEVD